MRHTVENLLAKRKDGRPMATRRDRCAHLFRSALRLGAAIFW